MTPLAAYGISLAIPDGWEGRAFRHGDGEPTIHLGNFPLPHADGEFGSRATSLMPADALFVALTEYRVAPAALEAGLFAEPQPHALDERRLSRRALLRPTGGQRGMQRFFTSAKRAFCLYVVVGRDGERHIGDANSALATLRVAPRSR